MSNVILDLSSKKFETFDIKVDPELQIIIFEGETEYKKAAKPSDIIGGDIIKMFSQAEPCMLRNTLWICKRDNPKVMFFILRKKGS